MPVGSPPATVRRLAAIALGPAQRRRSRSSLAKLHDSNDLSVNAVARALDSWLSGRLPSEDRAWFERIERRRTELDAATTDITIPLHDHAPNAVQTLGEVSKASVSAVSGELLFHLVRERRALSCIEFGTCLGISAAYQGAALRLNGAGRLVTIEGSPERAAVARHTLDLFDLSEVSIVEGYFADVLPGVLHDLGSVDYAFVDGHHDELATQTYHSQLLPYLDDGAVIVFDDIRWSEGMQRAWRTILSEPRISASVDLGHFGLIVVSTRPSTSPLHVRLHWNTILDQSARRTTLNRSP